ncbi:OLC1v1001054C1 [Oldenlandia corymbosa var. corymbosa]|uniref:OLC1v1001054C1 n=1 Tax=Oldenlandia corymbosa var. corymbosa TaxID=529605 RepID=A0AAV1D5J2_OLDCO|nr:OLC1v1001054C1 [Oldenlandia corymbosa var. corymbosa]
MSQVDDDIEEIEVEKGSLPYLQDLPNDDAQMIDVKIETRRIGEGQADVPKPSKQHKIRGDNKLQQPKAFVYSATCPMPSLVSSFLLQSQSATFYSSLLLLFSLLLQRLLTICSHKSPFLHSLFSTAQFAVVSQLLHHCSPSTAANPSLQQQHQLVSNRVVAAVLHIFSLFLFFHLQQQQLVVMAKQFPSMGIKISARDSSLIDSSNSYCSSNLAAE